MRTIPRRRMMTSTPRLITPIPAKINLDALKDEFPFKWRVQSFSKGKPLAICVPYCDARQVADVLDSVCGIGGWQCKYEDIGGVCYCHIGIKIEGEWVWKSDCGSESNIEKEKGEASDAFKRTGVKWGVGRFLYSMRTYMLTANKKKEAGDKPFHLWCLDDKKIKIPDWNITDYINLKRGCTKAIPAANLDSKGIEAQNEINTMTEWLAKYPVSRVMKALKLIGSETSEIEYKRDGISVNRGQFGTLCLLVKLTQYEDDLVDMCIEGFGFSTMKEVIDKGATEKILDECKVIKSQTPE